MSYTDIFMRCVEVILRLEGGYINHLSDPGGETNMGIARLFYPDLDIMNLTRNRAIGIYFYDYWGKMNLRNINNEELILQIFDFGVNTRSKRYGFNTALKTIQRLVKADIDGIVGPQTTGLINNSQDDLIDLYKRERRKYYFALVRRKPEMHIFLNGWMNRVNECKFNDYEMFKNI